MLHTAAESHLGLQVVLEDTDLLLIPPHVSWKERHEEDDNDEDGADDNDNVDEDDDDDDEDD